MKQWSRLNWTGRLFSGSFLFSTHAKDQISAQITRKTFSFSRVKRLITYWNVLLLERFDNLPRRQAHAVQRQNGGSILRTGFCRHIDWQNIFLSKKCQTDLQWNLSQQVNNFQSEGWRHIVAEAVLPLMVDSLKWKIFCISQPISLGMVFIDRKKCEKFCKNQVWYHFQSLNSLKVKVKK